MTITMELKLPYDNEIQFFDVCNAAAAKLAELAQQALDAGDHEQFAKSQHDVVNDVDEDKPVVGWIRISA